MSSHEPAPAPLETNRVRLRPIRDQDMTFLYEVMTAPESGGRVRFAGGTPSPEKVAASLWDSVMVQFIIEGRTTRAPRGLVALTTPNFRDGYAYLSALSAPGARGSGLIAEGVLLAFNYAFANWPFRKIYMEASEPSYDAFRSGAGRFFVEEGRLRQHAFWGGRYVDLFVLAVYRDVWERYRGRLLPLLTARADRPRQLPGARRAPSDEHGVRQHADVPPV